MSIGERAYKVLEEMSYERLGGTKEELSALEIIKREVDALGVENTIEDFEVNSFEIESAEFVVTKPKIEVYNVEPGYQINYLTGALVKIRETNTSNEGTEKSSDYIKKPLFEVKTYNNSNEIKINIRPKTPLGE
jgi:hypothetical protein